MERREPTECPMSQRSCGGGLSVANRSGIVPAQRCVAKLPRCAVAALRSSAEHRPRSGQCSPIYWVSTV